LPNCNVTSAFLDGAVPKLGWNFLNPLRSEKDLGKVEEVMNARNFSAFLKQFALLSQRQRAQLLALLHPVRDSAAAVIDTVTGTTGLSPLQ